MSVEIRLDTAPAAPGPMRWVPDRLLPADHDYTLVAADGTRIPAQLDADGALCWWGDERGDRQYTLEESRSAGGGAGRYKDVEPPVRLDTSVPGIIPVTIRGRPFTTFHYGAEVPKPFLYPVIGPTGAGVTRDYPMTDNPDEKRLERQDHPHHRSIWTAHGDIRTRDFAKAEEANNWHESPTADVQKVRRVVRAESGPVFGRIEAEIDWMTAAGDPKQLTERRTYTFFRGNDDLRVIDARIALHFTERDVLFADTKEGGILSLRTAVTMDEVGGGRMCNARGQVGEQQCWGKPAEWCDYVGPVGGETVGIAIFDSPRNFRHPTRWHIRGYGLFTANPFGLSHFDGPGHDGSKRWEKGESVTFDYRIVIHRGDTDAARVADQYALYTSNPPGT